MKVLSDLGGDSDRLSVGPAATRKPASRLNLDDARGLWLADLQRRGLSDQTIRAYGSQTAKLLDHLRAASIQLVTEFEPNHVHSFFLELDQAWATQQMIRVAARSFLRFLDDHRQDERKLAGAVPAYRKPTLSPDS